MDYNKFLEYLNQFDNLEEVIEFSDDSVEREYWDNDICVGFIRFHDSGCISFHTLTKDYECQPEQI